MINAVIIDDEHHAIETLIWKIENYTEGISLQATFIDPVEGFEYLKNNTIDLLFLDIEMPGLNGFELLQKLESIKFDVIFTTAYDEYGIKAIKYSALDYLLKPVQEEELQAAIAKYKHKIKRKILPVQLEALLQNMSKENKENRRIALATKESIELVYPKDIILCKADNNYTHIFIKGKRKKLISKTLKDFEELLEEHNFFRTHQSFLINIHHVLEFMRKDGGYIIMSNDMKVPISRSKKESFMNMML
ncbi:MAG: DNA-binding response regulator [Saprospiraceae bacterium]|nr:MAG: DNA-binding response regulator [Saprospiraceae bacterium]